MENLNNRFKFRAWEKEEKRMVNIVGINCETIEIDVVYKNSGYWLGREDYILMQYTGLKDKNEKEIFESDIIKKNDKIYKVVWDGGSLHIEEYNGDIFDYLLGNAGSSEIIGNIYENKDLI